MVQSDQTQSESAMYRQIVLRNWSSSVIVWFKWRVLVVSLYCRIVNSPARGRGDGRCEVNVTSKEALQVS